MLAIDTDLATPKDLSAIGVTVSTNNAVRHNAVSRLGPSGDATLPATLAVVAPEDASADVPLQVRVIGFQGSRARILRDVRTTFPTDGRVVLLRIPLRFVSDGSTTGELGDTALFDPALFVPTCASPEETVVDGECRDARVDLGSLVEFSPALVGRADQPGSCFDVAACFANAVAADLDPATCSFPRAGADPERLNVGLVGAENGVCVRPGACYVPLDRGSTSAGGFRVVGDRVELPPVVCRLLGPKKLAVHRADGCPAKLESWPNCAVTR